MSYCCTFVSWDIFITKNRKKKINFFRSQSFWTLLHKFFVCRSLGRCGKTGIRITLKTTVLCYVFGDKSVRDNIIETECWHGEISFLSFIPCFPSVKMITLLRLVFVWPFVLVIIPTLLPDLNSDELFRPTHRNQTPWLLLRPVYFTLDVTIIYQ